MGCERFSKWAALAATLLLASCGGSQPFVSTDAPWRAEEEQACLLTGVADRSPWVRERAALGGPSVCGAMRPLAVHATDGGRTRLAPPATLRCPMVPALDRWMNEVVQPAAVRHIGAPIVEMKVAASYACRPRNHQAGAKLSEHGFANAIDFSVFRFANGREVSVLQGWRGRSGEQAFLREIHRGACGIFTTVLGPNADQAHRDHFHLDLARHGKPGRTYCR
ncbi:MAG: extensin [Rhizobiales bacterium]|nr:extensin [Hyphomicrobiales bacterium]